MPLPAHHAGLDRLIDILVDQLVAEIERADSEPQAQPYAIERADSAPKAIDAMAAP